MRRYERLSPLAPARRPLTDLKEVGALLAGAAALGPVSRRCVGPYPFDGPDTAGGTPAARVVGRRGHVLGVNALTYGVRSDWLTDVNTHPQVRSGDCVVAFSRRDVHALRSRIEASGRHRCSVVYGALPPDARQQQASLFNTPRTGYNVLAASDAIGQARGQGLAQGRASRTDAGAG